MGLHRNLRDSRARQMNKEDLNLRNRVFWSAYILDRAVSLTLGRPFALAEHEIDVPVISILFRMSMMTLNTYQQTGT